MIKSESLKKNKDFQNVYRRGTSKKYRHLVMIVLKNQYRKNRLGISVSKKVGNSVVRHRITRLLREGYRLNESHFQDGLDLVLIVRPSAKDRTYFEMEENLMILAKRHKILNDSGE